MGILFAEYNLKLIKELLLQLYLLHYPKDIAEQYLITIIFANIQIGKVSSGLEQMFGRNPSANEIADELEMSANEVMDTLKISSRHLSLDAPFSEGEDNKLLDVLEDKYQPTPDNNLMKDSLKSEIQKALSTLTDREAEVICLYFGINREHSLTLEEIGEIFKLTRERVRQIKEKAIKRLRHTSRSKPLITYLS